MKTMLVALAGAALAAGGFRTAPAHARRVANRVVCARWHAGHCEIWTRVLLPQHRTAYRVGYVFGPNYRYTAYAALPHAFVRRFRLSPDYRYVYSNGYIYVVDPTSFAVSRIIRAVM